jgi:hypothetical protein
MRARTCALVVLVLLILACGDGDGAPTTTGSAAPLVVLADGLERSEDSPE